MKSIVLDGHIDNQHIFHVPVPADLSPGPIRVVVTILEGNDEAFVDDWMRGIGRQWLAELSDPREDIYTLEDGVPVDHKDQRSH